MSKTPLPRDADGKLYRCSYIGEIETVRGWRRWAPVLVGGFFTLAGIGIVGSCNAATMAGSAQTRIAEIDADEKEDRRDIRAVKAEVHTVEMENERAHSKLIESVTRIESTLQGLGQQIQRIDERTSIRSRRR